MNSNLKIQLVITKIMIIGNNVVLHPLYTWRIVVCVRKTLIILWFVLMLHVWGFSILQVQYFHPYVRHRWMNMLVVFTIIYFFILKALVALKKGTQLIKYSRQGKPKFCPFRVSPVCTSLLKFWDQRYLFL